MLSDYIETPTYISYHTPSPEAEDQTPFRSFSISLNRPWEHFVAQMVLNQNVDFTIKIGSNKPPDPLSRVAQLSASSPLQKLFKKFHNMPAGAVELKLPPVSSSVLEPSLLSMLEDKSMVHGLPEKVLYHLSVVLRHYPTAAPDSDFEIDLLTFRMTHALNLKEQCTEEESTLGVANSLDTEELFKSIRDFPSVYRSTEISRHVDLICGYFDRVKADQPSSRTQFPIVRAKLSVIRRDLWQLVRLLLRSAEANSYALEQDLRVLRKASKTLYQTYFLICSDNDDYAFLEYHFGKIETLSEYHLGKTETLSAGPLAAKSLPELHLRLKAKSASVFCVRGIQLTH